MFFFICDKCKEKIWIDNKKEAVFCLFFLYTPMHEVTPKVVAMAVSTVMTMFRILLQSVLFVFSMVFLVDS